MDNRTKANHQSWLNDSITQAFLEKLEIVVAERIPAQLIAARKASPEKLPDLVAELELTKAMIKYITTGEFLT